MQDVMVQQSMFIKKLASGIGLKLAEEGFVKFETGRNPAHRGIIIRASVNVVKP